MIIHDANMLNPQLSIKITLPLLENYPNMICESRQSLSYGSGWQRETSSSTLPCFISIPHDLSGHHGPGRSLKHWMIRRQNPRTFPTISGCIVSRAIYYMLLNNLGMGMRVRPQEKHGAPAGGPKKVQTYFSASHLQKFFLFFCFF